MHKANSVSQKFIFQKNLGISLTPFGFTDVVTDAVSNRERGLILDIHNMPKYFFEIPTYTI